MDSLNKNNDQGDKVKGRISILKDGKIGTISNHKLYPEFVLKSFYGRKNILCLDSGTGLLVDGGRSKMFNAEKGWYSDESEEYLNREAETKLQQAALRLTKKARNSIRDYSDFKCELGDVYNYFACQFIRDPVSSERRMEELLALGGIDSSDEMSIQFFQDISIKVEKEYNVIANLLNGAFTVVFRLDHADTANTEFIAINVPIRLSFREGSVYLLVVAPRVAICLVPWDMDNKLSLEFIGDVGPDFVNRVNKSIMDYAIKNSPQMVLGRDSGLLKSLWCGVNSKNT